jgi:hypothetical protein
VAPIYGPLALFALRPFPEKMQRSTLLEAAQSAPTNSAGQAKTSQGDITLKPFAAIGDEIYRLYHNVEA